MRRLSAAVLSAALVLGACSSDGGDGAASANATDATDTTDAAGTPTSTAEEVASSLLTLAELDHLAPEVERTSISELSARHRFAVGSRTDVESQTRAAAWQLGADGRWAPAELPAPPDADEHGATGVVEREDGSLLVHGWGNDARGVSFPALWFGTPGDWEVVSFPDLADDEWSAGVVEGVEHGGEVVFAGSRWRTDETVARLYRLDGQDLVEVPTALGDDPARLTSVATDGETLIVLGHPGVYEPEEPTFLLVGDSPDTLEREEVADFGQRRLDEIAPAGGGVWVLGGQVPGSSAGKLGLWIGAPGEWAPVATELRKGHDSIGDLRRTDGGRLLASGTAVWVSDDRGRTWRELSEPFGPDGSVSGSEVIDGRVVSAGQFPGGSTILREHVDAWTDAPAAEGAWPTVGGKRVWAGIGIAQPDEDGAVVFAGLEGITMSGGRVTRQLASYRYADGVWTSARVRSRGYVGGLVHSAETGYVMVGTRETDHDEYAGMTVHVSSDGTTWQGRALEGADEGDRRGHAAVVTSRGVLALGMHWEDGSPQSFGYRTLDGETFEPLTLDGLEDRGLLAACAAGDTVVAKLNDAEGARYLALSEDAGDTWRVLDEGPFVGEVNFGCESAGDRVLLTLSPAGEDQTIHVLETDGTWRDVTPGGLGPDQSVNDVYVDEASGTWVVAATAGGAVRHAVVAVSSDLETWHVLHPDAAAEEGDSVSAWEVVVATDGTLHVLGSSEGRDLHWTAPYADLLEVLGLA